MHVLGLLVELVQHFMHYEKRKAFILIGDLTSWTKLDDCRSIDLRCIIKCDKSIGKQAYEFLNKNGGLVFNCHFTNF